MAAHKYIVFRDECNSHKTLICCPKCETQVRACRPRTYWEVGECNALVEHLRSKRLRMHDSQPTVANMLGVDNLHKSYLNALGPELAKLTTAKDLTKIQEAVKAEFSKEKA
jgi:hypothetical protein